MVSVALARNAMATRFEMVLHGEDAVSLRAAGEEALDEVERLDRELSLYRADSELAHINARAGAEPVPVSAPVFALLQRAHTLSENTAGAFDISVAPLIRCWGFMHGSGEIPDPGALEQCRSRIGMHLVGLDSKNRTVRFAREGVMLDLGAIGKGYAVEKAAEILRDCGVASALIHGGTSTICAIGKPADGESWNVAIENPPCAGSQTPDKGEVQTRPLAVIPLRDESLSVSAVSGKFFQAGGVTFGHVLDPRTARPVTDTHLAAVVLPSATETDALSTALLVLGIPGFDLLSRYRPVIKMLLLAGLSPNLRLETRGF
jgi:thiamine biosynthesis lipoprotein